MSDKIKDVENGTKTSLEQQATREAQHNVLYGYTVQLEQLKINYDIANNLLGDKKRADEIFNQIGQIKKIIDYLNSEFLENEKARKQ